MDAVRRHFPGMSRAEERWLRRELLRRAASDYEQDRRWQDAATCWIELGEPARAAELYLQGGDRPRAARALIAAGRYLEALLHFQAWEVALAPGDDLNRARALFGQAACLLLQDGGRSDAVSREKYHQARALLHGQSRPAQLWAALGEYGSLVGRYDLVQEGYERALALCTEANGPDRLALARAYLDTVRARGDRLLCRHLEERLAGWVKVDAHAPLPPSPAPVQLVHVFEHSRGLLESIAFTPDGRYALSASHGGVVSLWDIAKRERVYVFEQDGSVWDAALSPDGRTFLTGCQNGGVRWWNVNDHRELHWFRYEDGSPIKAVEFLPDGRSFLAGGWWLSREVRLWDLEQRQITARFPHGDTIGRLAVSPDGTCFLSASMYTSLIILWDIRRAQEVRRYSHEGLASVAFCLDGRHFLSAGGKELRLWDVEGTEVCRFPHEKSILVLAVSPDGRRALTGSDTGELWLWDLVNRVEIERFPTSDHGGIRSLAFSSDGRYALSGTNRAGACLWRLPD